MLYLIRHCQTSGQDADAPLTPLGFEQADVLAAFLAERGVRRIVSSTHLRARQSVEPLAVRLGLPVETDVRLIERVLSTAVLSDWRERLLDTWADFDLTLPGGESSRAATTRGLAALDDALAAAHLPVAVVAHGNLISLLLHALDGRPGHQTWERLTNPDVFLIEPRPVSSRLPRGWPITRLWSA